MFGMKLVGNGANGRGFFERCRERLRTEPAVRLERFGKEAVEYARAIVPVDTGKLRDSIGYTFNPTTQTLSIHVDMTYGVYVEYGTSRMPPRPYIRPAVEYARHHLTSSSTVLTNFAGAGLPVQMF